MPVYIALLRAVNVGGTGKLLMSDLVELAARAGFRRPRTYIASGNLVFEAEGTESEVKRALEAELAAHAGRPVGAMVRMRDELAEVLVGNPFPDRPPNRTLVTFLDAPPPADTLDRVDAPGGEEVRLGRREIYVYYPEGMGRSKLKIPAARDGTARNVNTVARLVEIANSY